jgi:hypothetical protein
VLFVKPTTGVKGMSNPYLEIGMANIEPEISGLPNLWIYVSTKGNAKHSCRVKVSNIRGRFAEDNCFSVSVETIPRHVAGTNKLKRSELKQVKVWIRMNYHTLIKLWEHPDNYGTLQLVSDLTAHKLTAELFRQYK